jgi:uncharacterized membrane protein YqjE
VHTEKSIATILAETRDEIKQFIATRVNMLKMEIGEKVRTLKSVVPLLLVALALLWAGWMAFTLALIALLHGLFMPSVYAWGWAALIVAGAYLVLGIAVGWFVYAEIKAIGLAPNRTLTVLKQDQTWIQNEARTA